MPSLSDFPPVPDSAVTADCNFAYVVPTALSNLSQIADSIIKSAHLSTKLLSPLPSFGSSGNTRTQVPVFYPPSMPGNETQLSFDPFGVPFTDSEHTWIHIILTTILIVSITIIIIFGNALVIIAVYVDKNLKGIQNYFIVSLAVADFLVGLTIMPFSLTVEVMGKWIFGQIMCNLWLGGDVLLCTASILNLCMISIDRFWSVTLAGQYTARVRKHRVTVMIVLVWILSTIISLPALIGIARKGSEPEECELMDNIWYVIYSTFGSFYVPLVVMVVVYIRIYVIARRTARKSAFKLTKKLQQKRDCKPSLAQGLTKYSTPVGSPVPTAKASTSSKRENGRLFSTRGKSDSSQKTGDSASISSRKDNYWHVMRLKYFKGKAPATEEVDFSLLKQTVSSSTSTSTKDPGKLSPADIPTVIPEAEETSFNNKHISGPITSGSIVDNETAIHMASSMLGNLAMNLAKVHEVKEKDDVPELALTLANQASGLQQAVIAPMASVGSEICEVFQTDEVTPPSQPQDLGERVSGDGCGKSGETSDSSESPRAPSRGQSRSPENQSQSKLVSFSNPSKKPVTNENPVPQLSLAEEVERRKKRLAKERERRTTRILVIIMLSFIGCWLPFFTMYLITSILEIVPDRYVFATFFWLGYFNSALNPISYAAFNQDFRDAFKRLLRIK